MSLPVGTRLTVEACGAQALPNKLLMRLHSLHLTGSMADQMQSWQYWQMSGFSHLIALTVTALPRTSEQMCFNGSLVRLRFLSVVGHQDMNIVIALPDLAL